MASAATSNTPWTSTHTLRMSASLSSVKASIVHSREGRKDRRKGSLSSLQQQQQSSSMDDIAEESTRVTTKRAHRQSYFDFYPERGSPRIRQPSPPVEDEEEDEDVDEYEFGTVRATAAAGVARKGKARDDHPYTFPQIQERRAPSNRRSLKPHDLVHRDDMPALRFSSSSAATQAETPPQTPIESSSSNNSLDLIRVVAAPISGVEAMDALVDGMGGSDDDELFKRIQVGASSKLGKVANNYHPLYAPPLPKPPPGVVLGGALPRGTSDDDEEEEDLNGLTRRTRKRQTPDIRYSTISATSSLTDNPSIDEIIRKHMSISDQFRPKSAVPSITEIIRKNAGSHTRPASRATNTASSTSHSIRMATPEPEPEPLDPAEEAELIARSSMDSIAVEVQQTLQTLRNQRSMATARPNPSLQSLHNAPRSTGTGSIRSSSNSTSAVPPLSPFPSPDAEFLSFGTQKQGSQKDAIANYLRSTRITTLLKLTRRPHASPDHPLTVSISDLGSPTGCPLVVFLGLGCVRHVMGLYDEMAECLGLRLITIDRWGLGRTGVPPSSSPRGVPEWATVVDEVLDRLHIDRCSIMAHSAGAPYALSFASKYPERVIGDICLLAPWVGGGVSGGYRWLKYVPNGLLKTAQAAEWKIQAWMIGKPPKITFEGIGYDVKAPLSSATFNKGNNPYLFRSSSDHYEDERDDDGSNFGSVPPSLVNGATPYVTKPPRRNSSTNTFSDYDDLEDFGGRFESRSTLEPRPRVDSNITSIDGHNRRGPLENRVPQRVNKKKTSKGFLRIWKGTPNTANHPPMPCSESQPFQLKQPSRTLRTLKSIGSLRGRSSSAGIGYTASSKSVEKSPVLPEHDFGGDPLELGELPIAASFQRKSTDTPKTITRPRGSSVSIEPTPTSSPLSPTFQSSSIGLNRRAGGRRSVSFTTTTTSYSVIPSPSTTIYPSISRNKSGHSSPGGISLTNGNGANANKKPAESYQVALGNALIAASHAESSKGTHADLLQILNHEQRPWGFSYQRYPHRVRVWYGDRDERIAENAVRWMEQNMGSERCLVKVVKGADHGLMYKTNVVVEVLEQARGFWQDDDRL